MQQAGCCDGGRSGRDLAGLGWSSLGVVVIVIFTPYYSDNRMKWSDSLHSIPKLKSPHTTNMKEDGASSNFSFPVALAMFACF